MSWNHRVIARESGRPGDADDAAVYWIPAFAGMTPENWQAPHRFHFTEVRTVPSFTPSRTLLVPFHVIAAISIG